jgi:hypothetical protein
MGLRFNIPALKFDNWNQALETLAGLTSKGRVIIFLDEISWLAGTDKDFAAKLKGVWDTKFKKNPQLLLVICGSVSSWIQDNILNDQGFVGRVSLTINLEELSGWETIVGLQFENLVLNNLKSIIALLKIAPSSIISASPHFQHGTQRGESCQIDLLIRTRHTLYICEIKFRKKISVDVIDEVKNKMKALKFAKTLSLRPVLIYEGELAPTSSALASTKA